MSCSSRLCRLLAPALALVLGVGVSSSSSQAANVTVTANYAQQINTVGGWGASITWLTKDFYLYVPPANQTQILDYLYATNKPGAALSYTRIGTFLNHYNPSPGVYDWEVWSIGPAMDFLRQVKNTYGVDKVLASTWSPPAYMKTNGSDIDGGHVIPSFYPALAALNVQWLDAAKLDLGFDIDILSVQNEPNLATSYDSCQYTSAEMIDFTANYLNPAMGSRPTRIMAPEPAVYGGAGFFDSNWGNPLLSNAAMRSAVDIMATHGYANTSDLGDPSQSCLTYGKPIWQTEDYEGRSYNPSITDGQTWSTHFYRGLNLGNFSGFFHWWAWGGGQGTLVHNDCFTCPVEAPKRVYTFGQFSRFLRPGSRVYRSTSTSSSVQSTAAVPTVGKAVVVLSNTSNSSHNVTINLTNLASPPTSMTPYRTSATEDQAQLAPVSVSGGAVTITMPAKTVVTLVGQ